MINSWQIESRLKTHYFLEGHMKDFGFSGSLIFLFFSSFNRCASNQMLSYNLKKPKKLCCIKLYLSWKTQDMGQRLKEKMTFISNMPSRDPWRKPQCLHLEEVYHQSNQWGWDFYKCLDQLHHLVHWIAIKEYLSNPPIQGCANGRGAD